MAATSKGISNLIVELNKLVWAVESLEQLPHTDGELEELLTELAAAERDCREHFKRFSAELDIPHDKRSEESRADWSRCYERREKVIRLLTQFALTTNPE